MTTDDGGLWTIRFIVPAGKNRAHKAVISVFLILVVSHSTRSRTREQRRDVCGEKIDGYEIFLFIQNVSAFQTCERREHDAATVDDGKDGRQRPRRNGGPRRRAFSQRHAGVTRETHSRSGRGRVRAFSRWRRTAGGVRPPCPCADRECRCWAWTAAGRWARSGIRPRSAAAAAAAVGPPPAGRQPPRPGARRTPSPAAPPWTWRTERVIRRRLWFGSLPCGGKFRVQPSLTPKCVFYLRSSRVLKRSSKL